MAGGEQGTGASDRGGRYEEAAEEVLHQLRWCVRYLQKIRKPYIARAIASNCDKIEERLAEARRIAEARAEFRQ